MKEGLRFPLFQVSQKCIDDRLRGETEEKLREIDKEIKRIEEEVENANKAILMRIVDEMKGNFEEIRFNFKIDDQTAIEKVIKSCEGLERCAYDLRTLLRTYVIGGE